jgi:hypothetical protein
MRWRRQIASEAASALDNGGACLRHRAWRQQPHKRFVLVLGLHGAVDMQRPWRSSGVNACCLWPQGLEAGRQRCLAQETLGKPAVLCCSSPQQGRWGQGCSLPSTRQPGNAQRFVKRAKSARAGPSRWHGGPMRRPHLQAGAQVGYRGAALQPHVAGHLHATRHGHQVGSEAANGRKATGVAVGAGGAAVQATIASSNWAWVAFGVQETGPGLATAAGWPRFGTGLQTFKGCAPDSLSPPWAPAGCWVARTGALVMCGKHQQPGRAPSFPPP